LIANAGVLLEFRGKRYLVDGIHTNHDLEFDGVPETLLERMLSGGGELADLDYLLFTHDHPDHFSPAMTQTYLQNNLVQGIVLPSSGSRKLEKLRQYTEDAGIRCISPVLRDGQSETFQLGDARLTISGMRHMGAQFQDVQSCTLLLDFGGRTLLFTGDSDYNAGCFAQALGGTGIDVLFVNPLFYLSTQGRGIIDSQLRPAHVVVYHLPHAEKDRGRMSSFERTILQETEKQQPPFRLSLLDELGQKITL